MFRLIKIKTEQLLLCMLLASMTVIVLSHDLLAEQPPDDPNTHQAPAEAEQDVSDPNAPAVSAESTDIEELLVESRQTVDQQVVREHQEKKQAQKTAEQQEQSAQPDVPAPKEPEVVKVPPPVVPEKPTVPRSQPPTEPGQESVQQDSTDVEEVIEEVKITPRQRFEDKYIQKMLLPYTNFKQHLYDKHRISLAVEQVAIYQRATGGRRPREQSVYNFSLFGLWDLSRTETEDHGVVGFLFEERDNITRHNVEDFSREVGSTFRTHTLNSNERSRTALRQLWWRKKFNDGTATLTIGKIHHSSYYNRNAYAGSSRTHFLGAPFARNPNRILPQDGLGANIKIEPNDNYYLSLGFGDARSDLKTSGFDTIQDGDLMVMGEVGWTPEYGNYRFTVWNTDETVIDDIVSEEGAGVAFSFDRELYERVGIFGRYGFTEEQVSDMRNFASAGFVLQDPWGIKGDLLGCGVSWDENAETDKDEWAFEVFHRTQATKMLQITPSIQVIFDPTRSDKTEPVAVFGLRARMLF